MTVFIVATINIHDRDRYAEYEAGFMEIFARHEGEVMVVDESPLVLEGEWPHTRTVLIRFPNADAANRWYHSDEYQTLVQHRFAGSTANVIMVQELDAQPL